MRIEPAKIIASFFISAYIIFFSCISTFGALELNGTNQFMSYTNFHPSRSTSPLILHAMQWQNIELIGDSILSSLSDAFDSIEPEMTEPPLFYPNPFRLEDGAVLGYQLNRSDMDIEFRLYDMRGYEILKKSFEHGSNGAFIGYNKVAFDKDFLCHGRMPS